MKKSFGKTFYELRKEKGLTQDEVAQKLNVSPQAVSKWENDQTYPDVTLLVEIANLFDTTVDYLLGKENPLTVTMLSEESKKDIKDMLLKVIVDTVAGDKVRLNLPVSLLKLAVDTGVGFESISVNNKILESIDIEQVISLVEKGVMGKILEVDAANGDRVEIFVE